MMVVHQTSLKANVSYCGVRYSPELEPPGSPTVTCRACLARLFRVGMRPQHGVIPMRSREG